MLIEGVDHVQIAAPPGCEEDARCFFGEVLGLVELEKPSALRPRGGVWFQAGDSSCTWESRRRLVPRRRRIRRFGFGWNALDPLAARLEAAGAEVVWDEALDGTRRFYSEDPWGNRIELLARS